MDSYDVYRIFALVAGGGGVAAMGRCGCGCCACGDTSGACRLSMLNETGRSRDRRTVDPSVVSAHNEGDSLNLPPVLIPEVVTGHIRTGGAGP